MAWPRVRHCHFHPVLFSIANVRRSVAGRSGKCNRTELGEDTQACKLGLKCHYPNLMAKYYGTGSFSFRTVCENSVPLAAHCDGCRKCKHWRGTIQLNVHVHEWSLPKLTFATQISVSGLSPPSWSAEWRERDATILNDARCSRFPMFESRTLSVSQD